MTLLVAGIGNVWFGDDGFGSAVAGALAGHAWPDGVTIRDFGIRGMDLAFALTSGIDAAILVDATARGGTPGTLYVIEPSALGERARMVDGHAMDPARVLGFARELGALPAWIRVVGCEPAVRDPDDDGFGLVGLSEPVARAIAPAVALIRQLVADRTLRPEELACTS